MSFSDYDDLSDGIYYGYAQWPDASARERAKLDSEEIKKARAKMRDAVEESFPEVVLNPLRDYLEMPSTAILANTINVININDD